ncbi:c-type cytochrome [Niveispirillum irakense]|uniref:c-type cytochrome n=1 Tax=Niveispirillum irakense TaxID=34011 RepID=UPI000409F6D2|nr:c-type cytochrome [Niveispirillum irakense]
MRFGKSVPSMIAAGLLLALPSLPAAATVGDAVRGEEIFKRDCAACHALTAATNTKEVRLKGPHMEGIFGRTAGTQKGFKYSKTMRQSALVWDAMTLDNYLYDPPTTMKGTSMLIKTAAVQDRADLIAYLKKL